MLVLLGRRIGQIRLEFEDPPLEGWDAKTCSYFWAISEGKISIYCKIKKPLQAKLSTPESRVCNISQTVCNEVKGKNREEYGQARKH